MNALKLKSFSITCALAVAALCASTARAGAILTPISNTGSVRVQNFVPFSITDTPYANPYTGVSVTPLGGGYVISFTPGLLVTASATNASGGQTVQNSTKITFNLLFDAPIQLSASISEGGAYALTGGGMAGIVAGGTITAIAPDNSEPENLINSNLLTTFNPNNTWTGTENMGTMQHLYSNYRFSIDNDLFAYAFAGASLSTSTINKQNLSIFINVTPVPLPAAFYPAMATLALGALTMMIQRARVKTAVA